jgi:hypothetical protein
LKKKFQNEESNISVELVIEIEAYVNKLTLAFEKGLIEPESYIKKRKTMLELIEKSKDLVVSWRKEIEL